MNTEQRGKGIKINGECKSNAHIQISLATDSPAYLPMEKIQNTTEI